VRIRTTLVASLLVLSLIAAGCGGSEHARQGRPARATIPTLQLLPTKASRDSVAHFPCPKPQRTTIDMESCVERRILALNARVDKLLQTTWDNHRDPIGRRYYARAQRSWVTWVRDECTSGSGSWVDPAYPGGYAGGSEAPVLFGWCMANMTASRLRELQREAAIRH
jgi:uncharacterized protein YecT (DUF1311 family)